MFLTLSPGHLATIRTKNYIIYNCAPSSDTCPTLQLLLCFYPTAAGTSSDTVTIVGGGLGALVVLLLAYGVIATIVNVVLIHRIRRGKASVDQPVYAG